MSALVPLVDERGHYSAQRQQLILALLQQNAQVTVAELAGRFGVSRPTIRRDLAELRAAGALRRTYGGAVLADHPAVDAPLSERMVSHQEEKARIGRRAAELIGSGQTIFMDGGSTVECMAPYLSELRNLTVVTFGLNIINRLVCCANITLIVLGGTLDRRSLTIGGALGAEAHAALGIRYDWAFIAASGVSAEDGVTNSGFEEIPMKRRASEAARGVVLLADASKVGQTAAGLVFPIRRLQRLITGSGAPAQPVESIRREGVLVDLV